MNGQGVETGCAANLRSGVRRGLRLVGLLLWLAASPLAGQDPAPPAAVETRPEADPANSSPEALSAFSQAATLQNNRAFDLAAEAWQKFLDAHPDDPRAVDAQYNLGVCYLELKEFTKARESLQAALGRGQTFSRREDAFLNLGWAVYTLALQNQPGLFAEAERAFATLLDEYPQGQYRDQAWFLRGESLYLQGKRAEAVQAYQQLVQLHRDSSLRPNGLYALGVTQEELGQWEQAATVYDQFLAEFADQPLAAEVRMRKAETVLQRGDPATAESLFAAVSREAGFSQADHARYRQAYCAAQQEHFAEAAELFAGLTRDFPDSRYHDEATMAAARAYFRAGDDPQAATWFDQLLDGDGPAASEAAHWRARLFLKANEVESALQLIDRVLPHAQTQGHPFAANLRMDQADAMYELPDRKRQAMELYLGLARDLPDDLLAPQALYNAAFAALDLKEYPDAQRLTQDFLSTFPEHRLVPDIKRIAAEAQLQLGDSAAAEKTFGELASLSDNPGEAGRLQLRQAIALYMQQKYDETLTHLTTQLDSFSLPDERAEALYLIGMAHFGQEQFDPARQALEQSLEANPRWRQADETLLYLSRALRQLDQPAEAKAAVERLLREFPDSSIQDQATYRLGEYAYALEDYAAAATHYQSVVDRWPDSRFAPYALHGRGWSALRQSKFDEAQAAFGQVLARFPTHALAKPSMYARALARQQAGQFQESLQDLQDYLQRDLNRREQSDALYVRGLCLVGLGQHQSAIEAFQAVIAQDPEYEAAEKVLYELAWAHKAIEQPDPALDVFRRLASRFPQGEFAAEALYHIGEADYDAGQYEQAVSAYQQAAAAMSDNGPLAEKIHYKLGWALYQREQYEPARAAFAKQLERAPQGELAGDGCFMQGECLFKLRKYEAALQQYTLARDRTVSSEQISTLTFLHAGQAAGQLQQWQESYDWLAEVARKYPESPLLLQIGYELSVAQQNLGNIAEAERLFGSIADRATGELAARSRFMLGEVLYAKQQYAPAIREFRKVMFGFDPGADPQVAPWQAKAGLEAGQCAGILASQQNVRSARQQYVELATRFFQYVRTRHPGTDEATAATEQLKKYGVK